MELNLEETKIILQMYEVHISCLQELKKNMLIKWTGLNKLKVFGKILRGRLRVYFFDAWKLF